MDQFRSRVIILVVACVLFGVGLIIYAYFHEPSIGGDLILRCELPTERPTMSALAVNGSRITNCSEARLYAAQYFPQLINATCEESEPGEYWITLNEEIIIVNSSGRFCFSRNIEDDAAVSKDEFPVEAARSSSISFIESHGGLGQYTENYYGAGKSYSTDDPSSYKIRSYFFEYHREYEGYTIFGQDAICIDILPDYTIWYYSRGVFELGNSTETSQVISAEIAWNVAREVNIGIEDVDITEVELCYYIPYNEEITVMYPAWRFSGPEIALYVNAFTGEYMGAGSS